MNRIQLYSDNNIVRTLYIDMVTDRYLLLFVWWSMFIFSVRCQYFVHLYFSHLSDCCVRVYSFLLFLCLLFLDLINTKSITYKNNRKQPRLSLYMLCFSLSISLFLALAFRVNRLLIKMDAKLHAWMSCLSTIKSDTTIENNKIYWNLKWKFISFCKITIVEYSIGSWLMKTRLSRLHIFPSVACLPENYYSISTVVL